MLNVIKIGDGANVIELFKVIRLVVTVVNAY